MVAQMTQWANNIRQQGETDCELAIQGFTALVFGAHDPQDFPLHGWENPPPNVQAMRRTMFPRRTAFLHENF